MSGVSARVCIFAVPTALFTLLRDLELCDFLSVPHGSTSILLDFGAVMMLGERQSGETIFSALPEPFLNVDMLIVTFKFLPFQTACENTLHFTTGVFKVLGMIFRKVYSLFMAVLPLA